MVLAHHLTVIISAVPASQIQLSPQAVRGPARPAVRTQVATLGIAIVRPRVAARKRPCAGRALGKPVKAPFQIVPDALNKMEKAGSSRDVATETRVQP